MSALGALEAQAGDGGLVCGGSLGGSAEVAQVVHVQSALGGAHHQACPVWSEVNGGQWGLHTHAAENTAREHTKCQDYIKAKDPALKSLCAVEELITSKGPHH